jgi:hypothetical protein
MAAKGLGNHELPGGAKEAAKMAAVMAAVVSAASVAVLREWQWV